MNRPATQHKRAAYPAYKPSGIEWLGEIPEHWEVKRAKSLLAKNDGGIWGEDFDDDGVIVLRSTEQTVNGEWNIVDPAKRRLTSIEYASCHLQAGDLIVTKSSGSSLHIGKTSIVTKEVEALNCCYSNFMQRLRVNRNTEPRFVWYVLNGELGRKQFDYYSSTTTGLANLNGSIIGNVGMAVPPLNEQRAIAAFLDRETARIDTLIEKKQRQIELLQEKRSALISHSVTKGLDPNAKMKDSGVEWIGSIPAQWEVKRLKFVVSEPLKYGANEAAELDDPELPRYIRITDVDENGRLRDETFKSIPEDVARPYLLKEGDLLLARSGATVGKSFYYEPSWGRAAYAGYLIRARFNPTKTMPRFINYFTNSQQYWQWLSASFIQATIQNVSAEKYANLIVPVPPFEEQKRIVRYLDSMWQRLNKMTDKVRQSIQILKEYRLALISAAVTGKIDVRTVPSGRQEEVS